MPLPTGPLGGRAAVAQAAGLAAVIWRMITVRTAIARVLAAIVVAGLPVVPAACGDDRSSPTEPQPPAQTPTTPATGCARTSTGLIPLTDMGSRTYQGEVGGLHPGGNVRPWSHESAGIALARAIEPRGSSGSPNPAGRYALVSIGMSNTTQEFSAFKQQADLDRSRDPRLVVVDGAQGGMTASNWSSRSCSCWSVLDSRLGAAGVSAGQVAVVWVKLANAGPTRGFPYETNALRDQTAEVLRMLKARFPNLVLAYLSSRIYAGYATSTLNPEPYAYESGFAVRWLVDAQVRGDASLDHGGVAGNGVAPWISWGPYLWADGLVPRSDGLTWACSELGIDGTHPSTTGREKVAGLLLGFVQSDATAREWYLANP